MMNTSTTMDLCNSGALRASVADERPIRNSAAALVDPLLAAVYRVSEWRRKRRAFAEAHRTLSSLDPRLLADLGVRPGGMAEYATVVASCPGRDPREVL